MLSEPLTDQQSLNDFIKGKTDRQIAIMGLTIIDQHVKECTDRWKMISVLLRFVSAGVVLIMAERVATDVHWKALADFIRILLGS